MCSDRILFSLATFMYVLVSQAIPAHSASVDATAYSHLVFSAERIQDQLPLKPSQSGQRTIGNIAGTKYKALIDLYYIPGDVSAPTFGRARFTVRRDNHAWREIDTEFLPMEFFSSEGYQKVADSVAKVSRAQNSPRGADFDYNETPMPANTMIVSALEASGGIEKFLANASLLSDESRRKLVAPPILEFHFAISRHDFSHPNAQFAAQVRLAFELYNFEVRTQSVQYRKMLYGTAKTTLINQNDLTEISRLLFLNDAKCEDIGKKN